VNSGAPEGNAVHSVTLQFISRYCFNLNSYYFWKTIDL
jgi:hypothetical protein